MRSHGHEVVECVDPGGTEIGSKLRDILLYGRSVRMSPRTEALLFSASRAELAEQVIKPALARGAIVISDRYLLSNVVSHGYAGGLNPADLWCIDPFGTSGIVPGLTLVLDLSVEQSLIRRGRTADRMESRGLEYAEKVRSGFLAEAARQPEITKVIDASSDEDSVQAEIRSIVTPWLAKSGFDLH